MSSYMAAGNPGTSLGDGEGSVTAPGVFGVGSKGA